MVTDIYRVDKEEKETRRAQRKFKKPDFWISVTFPPSEVQDWELQHVVGHDFFKVIRRVNGK